MSNIINPIQGEPKAPLDSSLEELQEMAESNSKKPEYLNLLKIIEKDVHPFLDPSGQPYISFIHDNKYKTASAKSAEFKNFINSRYFSARKKVLGDESLKRAINHLCAIAYQSGEVHNINIRSACVEGKIIYDLCDHEYQKVETGSGYWKIINSCPEKFIRKKGMLPNVVPDSRGHINLLRKYLNLPNDNSWYLVACFILQAIKGPPYPILVMSGEQGTGKSTNSRVISTVIDPSVSPLNSCPRNERDIALAASNGLLFACDNVSGTSSFLADILCRMSTGGAFRTRQLFTDDEETVLNIQKPVLLNGIDDLTNREDLKSRCLFIELSPIPSSTRTPESIIEEQFKKDLPLIMGGIFNALAVTLKNLKDCKIDHNVRMADFMLLGHAASEALGISKEDFTNAYMENIREATRDSFDLDPVCIAISRMVRLLPPDKNEWIGTITELATKIEAYMPLSSRTKEKLSLSPQALSNHLKRLSPTLRSINIEYQKLPRESGTGRRLHSLLRKRTENTIPLSDDRANSDNTSQDSEGLCK